MNQNDYNQDVDLAILTDAEEEDLLRQIEYIDNQLAECGDSSQYQELQRERAHAVDELAAGRRLLLAEMTVE